MINFWSNGHLFLDTEYDGDGDDVNELDNGEGVNDLDDDDVFILYFFLIPSKFPLFLSDCARLLVDGGSNFPLTFPPIVVHIHHILAMCEHILHAFLTFSEKNMSFHNQCKSNQQTPSSLNNKDQLMKITSKCQFPSLK